MTTGRQLEFGDGNATPRRGRVLLSREAAASLARSLTTAGRPQRSSPAALARVLSGKAEAGGLRRPGAGRASNRAGGTGTVRRWRRATWPCAPIYADWEPGDASAERAGASSSS
jgi:hypothetical protein